MLSAADRQRITINIWTARCIPMVLAGVVGYATYVLVVPLCAHYLLIQHQDVAAAIAILIIYFLLFLLMAASLLRLLHITIFDPPYLALGPAALRNHGTYNASEKEKPKSEIDGIGGAEYHAGTHEGNGGAMDPDSPGLELFYTKDVFSSEVDGKPKWCSHCANWKPDRTHHCSDAGRCILKMDHFCPWVGGPVGETNFKFFTQYTWYTALYCLHLLVVMAVYLGRQIKTEGETYNPQFAAILGLATFFFLFTAGMTGTSIDLVMKNLTQVERLGSNTRIHTLAILKPSAEQLRHINPSLAQPNYREITYPLPLNKPPASADFSTTTSGTSHSTSSEIADSVPTSGNQPSVLRPASGTPSDPLQSPVMGLTSASILNHPNESAEGNSEILHQATKSQASAANFVQHRACDRDLMASRTFAILDLKQGHNPWDLGSRLLNWETVMGSNFIDWILPIRRSPCCNHDDAESQFLLGPSVDLLKSSVGFIRREDMRAYGGRKRSERRITEDVNHAPEHMKHRRRKRRNNGRDPPVQMDDLEHQA